MVSAEGYKKCSTVLFIVHEILVVYDSVTNVTNNNTTADLQLNPAATSPSEEFWV